MPNESPHANDGAPTDEQETPARESVERAAAFRRGAAREAGRATAAPHPLLHGSAEAGAAERAFQALADNVRDYAIFLMNADGVILYWGEGARLMKWWSKAQAEGGHLRMLYPDGGAEDGTAEEHLRDAAESGEYTGEGHRVRSDHSTFWAGVTLTALSDDGGKLLGFAKVTRDLTAWRAADAALVAARQTADEARSAAEAANRAKSGFLATMSHEIRTPVNAILGYQDLLDMEIGGPLTPDQRRYLERARVSGRHLLALIDDILDLSRLEAERMLIARSVVRIGAVVNAALSLVAPQAHARSITINDAVSGYAGAVACWGDEERVQQILVNLLSNAIKFTDVGGRVTVSAGLADQPAADANLRGAGPWAYVRVEDTGHGIPPDRLDAVFEPFVQVDMSHTRVHGGSGLGLSISRRLARLMGGDVVGRSEVEAGSNFFLWLRAAPVTDALPTDTRPSDDAPGKAAGSSAGRGAPPAEALRDVADALLGDIDRILHAYVARLRSDPEMPSAHGTSERELEDHMATFLADVTQGITVVGAARAHDGALRDATAIQRVVADRHGRQRARLGWSEAEVRHEFVILGEELAAAVTRARLREGSRRSAHAEDACTILAQFVAAAERVSLESFAAARRDDGERGATVL